MAKDEAGRDGAARRICQANRLRTSCNSSRAASSMAMLSLGVRPSLAKAGIAAEMAVQIGDDHDVGIVELGAARAPDVLVLRAHRNQLRQESPLVQNLRSDDRMQVFDYLFERGRVTGQLRIGLGATQDGQYADVEDQAATLC